MNKSYLFRSFFYRNKSLYKDEPFPNHKALAHLEMV